jgi:hypothetical protein
VNSVAICHWKLNRPWSLRRDCMSLELEVINSIMDIIRTRSSFGADDCCCCGEPAAVHVAPFKVE